MRSPSSFFFVAALSLAACAPHIREGFFACNTGPCPSGWVCAPDGLCYRSADGSTQDGSTQQDGSVQQDASTPKALYDSCAVGQAGSASCASGLCTAGPDPMAITGQCSTACTDDASCPGAPNAWCVAGTCIATCQTTGSCPSGLDCYRLATRTGKACFAVNDQRLDSDHSCTAAADCQPYAPCLLDPVLAPTGVCSWVCSGPNDACPFSAECVDVSALHSASPTGYACLSRCTPSCGFGLTCVAFPGNQKHCVPSGW